MSEINYFQVILTTLGGLGLFIYGMHIMAEGLQKVAGTKMKRLLEVLTNKKGLGMLVGALITAIIQSSSGTTVMVVGFVNAGLMSINQSVGVIMGAHIGTTVTSWLVSSSEWMGIFAPTLWAPLAIVVGAFTMMMVKKKSITQIGEIVTGFGMLFMGISVMAQGVAPLKTSPTFAQLFLTLGSNPILGVLVGAFVTGLIQSSAASIGILQSLAASGLVPWGAAVFIVMGQNIGTCVTAILSGIGASRDAKRAACIHLLFSVVGTVIFGTIGIIFFKLNESMANQLISQTQISIVHTFFNISTAIILYPFSDVLVKLSSLCIKGGNSGEEKSEQPVLQYLDERILKTPNIAVQSSDEEVIRMGNIVRENFRMAVEALLEKNADKINQVSQEEERIDKIDKAVLDYLVKICNLPISEEENNLITTQFHTVNDFERVGDHSMNIAEIAQYLIEENADFSEKARKDLEEMIGLCTQCFDSAIRAKELGDLGLARKAIDLEQQIDDIEERLRTDSIQRLANNMCNTKSSVAFLDVLTNLERISDHAKNVSEAVILIKEKKREKEATGIKNIPLV